MRTANPCSDADGVPIQRSLARQQLLDDVRSHFATVDRVESMQVERLGRCVMDADLFVCRHYLGPESPGVHR